MSNDKRSPHEEERWLEMCSKATAGCCLFYLLGNRAPSKLNFAQDNKFAEALIEIF